MLDFRVLPLCLLVSACTCAKEPERPPPPPAATPDCACACEAPAGPPAPEEGFAPCPPGALGDPLARAVHHYDAGEYEEALACASLAVTLQPADPAAEAELGAALVALGRPEEARLPFALALARDPDLLDALHGAADLYLTRLEPRRAHDELGLAYAERGRLGARRAGDGQLAAGFAYLEAVALNSLGRSQEALVRADEAISAGIELSSARRERAFALWELCRFEEARGELEQLLETTETEAFAHHYLGLLAERAGDADGAEREFGLARALDPEGFPAEPFVSAEELSSFLARAVAELPEKARRELEGVDLDVQDVPELEDLVSGEPPLSPGIVGLFRGPPLGEPCPPPEQEPGPCRAIRLYRKNLMHTAGTLDELWRQARITLVHEIGHLRGEDDDELIARGLE